MTRILAGVETEYGLLVEGRGASSQVEDSMALVRKYPGECLALWDYRNESPRSDLRGFQLKHLDFDPEDAKFDIGKTYGKDQDVRSDRILPNGARFYNDHGHPEYSTPECWTLNELVRHDVAGQSVVLAAAKAYESEIGVPVKVYKNNTDYHGASYGTHESYLVPRSVGIDRLIAAVTPMLIVRQILSGAGKVGVETGSHVPFQLSQRADFFMEPINAETLYRRPIFNTRDEPHSDPGDWIRLHVISGDANMIGACTGRKVGLIKLALRLLLEGEEPVWKIADPVRTIQNISRDQTHQFRIDLASGSWTTGREVLNSYFDAVEWPADSEEASTIADCRQLLDDLDNNFDRFARSVDWAAKLKLLQSVVEEESLDWKDPVLQAYDLEYCNVDPEDSLHEALQQMGEVEPNPTDDEECLANAPEGSRAIARGTAVHRFADHLLTASWRSLVLRNGAGDAVEVELKPNAWYPSDISNAANVDEFIRMIQDVK